MKAMPYKTILVHAEAAQASDARVRLAVQVAGMFGSKVIGLAAEGFFPIMTSGYAASDSMVIDAVRERIAADLPVAEQRFRTLTAEVDDGVVWITGYDYPAVEIARHARGADLVIAARPPRGCNSAFAAPAADVVLEAGVPVLMAADSEASLRADHVLVAWKNTRESRRALADALPFLMRATKVTVLVVSGESDEVEQVGLHELAARLARHGVNIETLVAPKGRGTVAETIERTATRLQADLIVMGAYGHSRLQEWVLGGVTEDLLATSPRFVLFSH